VYPDFDDFAGHLVTEWTEILLAPVKVCSADAAGFYAYPDFCGREWFFRLFPKLDFIIFLVCSFHFQNISTEM
jgi:hypothetical protein